MAVGRRGVGVEMRNSGEMLWVRKESEAPRAMTMRRSNEEVVDDAVPGDETPINQGDFLDRGLADGMRAAARHTPAARLKRRTLN